MGSFSGLGAALKNLRRRRGLNQAALASLCGLSRGTVSGYETGRENATIQSLEMLLDALGFSVVDLGKELSAAQAGAAPAAHLNETEELGAELGGAILRILREAGVTALSPSDNLQKNVTTAIDRVVGPPKKPGRRAPAVEKGKR